jgi:hypothetical protein
MTLPSVVMLYAECRGATEYTYRNQEVLYLGMIQIVNVSLAYRLARLLAYCSEAIFIVVCDHYMNEL